MISDALRQDIERYSSVVKVSNPMFVRAADGTLGQENVARYLTNILHLLQHTPLYLERAKNRAMERGDGKLADYFERKLGEEAGHDEWAVSDIERFSTDFRVECSHGIVPSLSELLEYLRDTIDEDPTLYLAYILFAEYFTVLEAPEWLALLEERCGVPRQFMSAVANHAELDKHHVHEGLDAIDALVADPSYLTSMREALRRSIGYFDRFMVEVAETPN